MRVRRRFGESEHRREASVGTFEYAAPLVLNQQLQLRMESDQEMVPLAEDGYFDDWPWYGSFSNYRHHRRTMGHYHGRLNQPSQDTSSAARDHTATAHR
jgi:hypothetical protein